MIQYQIFVETLLKQVNQMKLQYLIQILFINLNKKLIILITRESLCLCLVPTILLI